MRRFYYILIVFCALLIVSCQQKDKSAGKAGAKTIVSTTAEGQENSDVDSALASKGVITSEHDIPIYSMVSEAIKEKLVKEGMRVRKGQTLFSLDGTMHQSEIEKVQREIEQARFQYQNILVGQGFDVNKPENIPAKIKGIARTRSSLNLYEQELHQQNLVTAYYTIKSPIDGVVTDVQAYQYDLAEKGKELCRIVDTEHLQVTFSILENEISKFEKGAVVHFSTIAYPNIKYIATVTQVSPKVDENGMIKIKAIVQHDRNFDRLKVGMTAIVKK